MKNYNVSDQLNMQEQLISDESRMNTDEKIELNEHKQDNSVVNQQSASHDNKKKNNQCFNLPKLDSSYALSLFAPIPEKQEIFSKRKSLNKHLNDSNPFYI
jgi:hypothetical protein